MATKKIIPCLDIKNGRIVKGVNFVELKDVGDPLEIAKFYESQGADEIVLLDISATLENRQTFIELVKKVAPHISIPFTVGGGIKTLQEAQALLQAGARKISINSSAVSTPELINEIAETCGSDALVVAIDIAFDGNHWKVTTHGGTRLHPIDAVEWAKEVAQRGAGEILLTSMGHDGTKQGFALEITDAIAKATNIPVTASGGAGSMEHFKELFLQTQAQSGLAASVFHFQEIKIPELKQYLHTHGITVKL